MRCLLDDLRPLLGINADQWTTAAQEERELRKMAEQKAERFMEKWIAAAKVRAGLRHACISSMSERDGKGQGEDLTMHAC